MLAWKLCTSQGGLYAPRSILGSVDPCTFATGVLVHLFFICFGKLGTDAVGSIACVARVSMRYRLLPTSPGPHLSVPWLRWYPLLDTDRVGW